MSRQLPIDEDIFIMAFGRDVDFHDDYPQTTFLNLSTGEIHWIYDADEDADDIGPEENKKWRLKVSADPGRFLEIPGLSHGDCHDILREFLGSDWTDDEDEKSLVDCSYFGSIGAWKKQVRKEVSYAYDGFQRHAVLKQAQRFLADHDVDPGWEASPDA